MRWGRRGRLSFKLCVSITETDCGSLPAQVLALPVTPSGTTVGASVTVTCQAGAAVNATSAATYELVCNKTNPASPLPGPVAWQPAAAPAVCQRELTHTHTHTHAHSHTLHTHTHTHSHTQTHTLHTHTHTQIQTHMHTLTRKHKTHTCIHTERHTDT